MEESSVGKASMVKASMVKASVKASAASDEIDELRRLPHIGHDQARLYGSR
jgi:hypothetical protein